MNTGSRAKAGAVLRRCGMAAKMSLFVLLASGIRAASAQEVRMTCQGSGKSYWVSYDPKTRQFRSNHAEAGSGFKVKRDQVDKEGVLVWIGAGHLGGERDMLVFFGQEEKWVRLFFGNGSQVLERCR